MKELKENWPVEAEDRMEKIMQNGNTGEHYELEGNTMNFKERHKSKAKHVSIMFVMMVILTMCFHSLMRNGFSPFAAGFSIAAIPVMVREIMQRRSAKKWMRECIKST